jgi:hypothetical protein
VDKDREMGIRVGVEMVEGDTGFIKEPSKKIQI